jgi:hypothetical protein
MLTTAALVAGLLAGSAQVAGVPTAIIEPAPVVTPAGPDCDRDAVTGECRISVSGESRQSPTGKDGKPGSKSVKKVACQFEGNALPCSTAEGFWDPASGCYLTPQSKPSTLGDVKDVPPGTRFYRCWKVFDVVDGKPQGMAVFESIRRTPGQMQTIDPRVAAQQVVESMNFVAPQLGLSPYLQSSTHEAIVNVPIWMWASDPGATTTGPQTKRAAIAGVAIEATGTVDRIEWSMGGGEVVTCKGAGTPFDRAAAEGKSLKEIPASPTCGHKYRKTSRCEKSGSFQITATAYWNVHWTGGGAQGDIPLNFSRSLPLRVVDLRPVLVAPDGTENLPQSTTPARSCP